MAEEEKADKVPVEDILEGIEDVHINVMEETVTVEFHVVRHGLTMPVVWSSAGHAVPGYLQDAIRQFLPSCARYASDRCCGSFGPRCAACTAACCFHFESVYLTDRDVQHLRTNVPGWKKLVELFDQPSAYGPSVGRMAKKPMLHPNTGEEIEGCAALDGTLCSIYQHRPRACRAYTEFDCELFEQLLAAEGE